MMKKFYRWLSDSKNLENYMFMIIFKFFTTGNVAQW
jgi:hypothetical protein